MEQEHTSGYQQIAGILAGSALYVDQKLHGAGLGTALAMTGLLQDRELPGWYDEVPEYSPAGIAPSQGYIDSNADRIGITALR